MRRLLIVLVLMALPGITVANTAQSVLAGSELRGSATFRFAGVPIYDAQLFTPGGAALDWSKEFALELTYRRNFSAKALVDSTMEEIDRIGSSMPVKDQFTSCFQAVSKGDSYSALYQSADRIEFWRNDTKTCQLNYPDIGKRFMSIFLGDDTRSQSFTNKLKGG